MAKQPTSLGGLVKKGSSGPTAHAAPAEPREAVAKPPSADLVPLNFKVPADFNERFRIFAVRHRMKLNELLIRAFDDYESTKS